MRPYYIHAKDCMKMWVDLDHILAINDPHLPKEKEWSPFLLAPYFSMVMMFRNEPLVFNSFPNEATPEVWVQILASVKQTHADLVTAWKSKG